MKKLMLVAVVVLMCGCSVQPGQNEEMARTLGEGLEKIVEVITVAEVVRGEDAAKLTENSEATKEVLLAMGKKLDENEEEERFLAYVKAGKAGSDAAIPFTPYAAGVSGILSIVLALLAKKKNDEARESNAEAKELGTAVREIVAGIEKFKTTEGYAASNDALKDSLRDKTSPTTKTVIAEARN